VISGLLIALGGWAYVRYGHHHVRKHLGDNHDQ